MVITSEMNGGLSQWREQGGWSHANIESNIITRDK